MEHVAGHPEKTKKVPCNHCGALILPRTHHKYGGLCARCGPQSLLWFKKQTVGKDLPEAGRPKVLLQGSKHDPFSSPTLHGLLFDAAVFAGLALFYFDIIPLPVPSEFGSDAGVPDWVFGLWLAGAILTQILGALLKAPFQAYRLRAAGTDPAPLPALLWWVHFLFFTVLAALSLGLLGWDPDPDGKIGPLLLWFFITFGIGGLTTLAASSGALLRPLIHPGLEYLGDFLLLVSVLILTRMIWNPIAELFTPADMGVLAQMLWLLCGLMLFVFFYLPPRLLFLVEDGHYGRTWVQIIGIALAPLLWHVLWG